MIYYWYKIYYYVKTIITAVLFIRFIAQSKWCILYSIFIIFDLKNLPWYQSLYSHLDLKKILSGVPLRELKLLTPKRDKESAPKSEWRCLVHIHYWYTDQRYIIQRGPNLFYKYLYFPLTLLHSTSKNNWTSVVTLRG